jgi:hypothetical protein
LKQFSLIVRNIGFIRDPMHRPGHIQRRIHDEALAVRNRPVEAACRDVV